MEQSRHSEGDVPGNPGWSLDGGVQCGEDVQTYDGQYNPFGCVVHYFVVII